MGARGSGGGQVEMNFFPRRSKDPPVARRNFTSKGYNELNYANLVGLREGQAFVWWLKIFRRLVYIYIASHDRIEFILANKKFVSRFMEKLLKSIVGKIIVARLS